LMLLLPRCLEAMSSDPRPRYWCSASKVTRCSLIQQANLTDYILIISLNKDFFRQRDSVKRL
jgi:hypothetical protein